MAQQPGPPCRRSPWTAPARSRSTSSRPGRPEEAVADGTPPPGTLLGDEIGLAARLGLSRPAVRQALRTLVATGLPVESGSHLYRPGRPPSRSG